MTRPSLCLGKFVALHIGHRALVKAACAFSRSPALLRLRGMAEVLGWEPRLPLLAPGERPQIFADWHRDGYVCPTSEVDISFADVRELEPREFVEYLKVNLDPEGVVCGSDFRFGHRRAGSATDLANLCEEYGLKCSVVNQVLNGQDRISSTRIRAALAAGEMEAVECMLGRQYRLHGEVVRGDGRGRGLGFPTANLGHLHNQPPGPGVYAAWAEVNGVRHRAALNVGVLPTIEHGRPLSVEAHLLDVEVDCYDAEMVVVPVKRLRGEQAFAELGALKAAIARDVDLVRATLQHT